ncbi:TPA: DUF1120 domain-containing protein [Klebsiella aerogenes]|nr:DUF1120 domain-containing protein [Klebsiella aerogenes]
MPAVSGGAVFDYGAIKAASLSQDDYTVLPRKNLDFSVTCDSPMKIAFSAVDARADSVVVPVGKILILETGSTITADDVSLFGLGTTSEGKKIGGYKAAIMWPITDGEKDVHSIRSNDGGQTWANYGASSNVWLNP